MRRRHITPPLAGRVLGQNDVRARGPCTEHGREVTATISARVILRC